MPAITRIYECEKFGTKYVLNKLSDRQLVLYRMNKSGELTRVQEKIYSDLKIQRKAYFRRNSEINAPTLWESTVPRLNKIGKEGNIMYPFSICNTGDIENINFILEGYVDKNGNINEVSNFRFNLNDLCDCPPLSNLARKYIRKLGSVFVKTPVSKWTYYTGK